MKQTSLQIAVGLGDNLVVKIFFDSVKHLYSEIRISHSRHIVNYYRNGDPKYIDFLNQIGDLLFAEPPYVFDHVKHPDIDTYQTMSNLGVLPKTPKLDHLLCKGESLNLGEEYIVITTKIRGIDRNIFYPKSVGLWDTLKELSKKYKIVVLGEREIERSKEYVNEQKTIYGIYEQIIANIPNDRIVDLTVPALGITVPSMPKLQQDFLILKEAKFVISLGIGGNLWMALAVSGQTIGFRTDNDRVTDLINNPDFTTAFITKDWDQFINKLREYK